MRTSTWLGSATLIWTLACKDGEPPPAQPDTPSDAVATPAEPTPNEPTPPTPSVPERPPYKPLPSGFGDSCDGNAGCGWDDPCIPTRCVGRKFVPISPGCDESAPPPGECTCVLGHCALRPKAVDPTEVSCRMSACGLDQGAGKCVEGAMLESNRTSRDEGPACHCGIENPVCTFAWADPIPCESVEQCWVSDSPPYHPVPRTPEIGKRKFKPCKDGEVGPACTNGHCTVVGWAC